eukprot:scaffold22473_cov56-Isochrysis_galbana.AAC.1
MGPRSPLPARPLLRRRRHLRHPGGRVPFGQPASNSVHVGSGLDRPWQVGAGRAGADEPALRRQGHPRARNNTQARVRLFLAVADSVQAGLLVLLPNRAT